MSLTLGHIHYWLFNKILFQNKLNNYLENYIGDLDLSSTFPKLGNKALELQIDTSNIHGWLQDKITIEEDRFAYIISILLNKENLDIDDINKLLYSFGKDNSIDKLSSINDLYTEVFNLLLDGMPCDRAVAIIENNEDSLKFKYNLDLHSDYFKKYSLDSNLYYELRTDLINGLLCKNDFSIRNYSDNIYIIEKR